MAIDAISSTSSSQSAYGLDFQSLLKIIMTQLTYQDPLKPMDNFQFVSQLAQFSQLQQSQTLNDKISRLLSAQGVTQATGLLGRTVDFASETQALSGLVQAVSFSGGAPSLTIKLTDGTLMSNIGLSSVSTIR
jgi:flagellar basal-body rod modification protein FlgD